MAKEILVVDDEEAVLLVLRQLLMSHGFVPHCAINGLEALGLMTTHNLHVVFTDLRMPNMDGMHLCRLIKQFAPGTYVYAVSAFVDAFSPGEFRAAGFDGRFRKPFSNDLIIRACHAAFQNVAQRGTGRDAAQPIERRKHSRILAEEQVQARVLACDSDPGLVGQDFECPTHGISEGGLQLWTNQALPVGTVLRMDVVVSENRQHFRLRGTVRWVLGAESEKRFHVGVMLSDVWRDRPKWTRFVMQLTGCGARRDTDRHKAASRNGDAGMTHTGRGSWKPGDRERRREPRVEYHGHVRVKIFSTTPDMDLTNKTLLCHGVDLSRHGIRIATDVHIPVGTELEMLLHVDDPPSAFIHRGKVRWTMPEEKPDAFSISIEFTKGGLNHLSTWNDVVERVWALHGRRSSMTR